ALYNAIMNMWKAVGVESDYLPMDSANSQKIIDSKPHPYDVELESYAWLAYDPTSIFAELGCEQPGTHRTYYCNSDFDASMKEGIRTLDPDKARTLFQKGQTIIQTELPYMPLWIEPEVWAINKKMHGGIVGRGPLND